MRRLRGLLLAAVATGLHAAGGAGPLALEATQDFFFQQDRLAVQQVTGLPRWNQFQESLSLLGTYRLDGDAGTLTGGLTVRDGDFYREQPNLTLTEPDLALYRKYLRYDRGGFTAQAGDFDTVLGRGLVLAVVQNSVILRDWAITGADCRYQGSTFGYQALDGVVSNDMPHLDHGAPAYNVYEQWTVSAAEGWLGLGDGVKAGYHVSRIDDRDLTDLDGIPLGNPYAKGPRVSQSLSLEGERLLDAFDVYLEAGGLRFQAPAPTALFATEDPARGRAGYGNLVYRRGGLYLMAEFKEYRHFDNELNNPPLADREDELVNKDESSGARFFAQYAFKEPDLVLFGSAGRCTEGQLSLATLFTGSNVYGGFKLEDLADTLSASYSYGLKTVHNYPVIGNWPERRSDGSLTWRLTPLWSLDLTVRDWRRHQLGQDPWRQTDTTLQWARSPRWAVFITNQYVSYANTPDNPYPNHDLNSAGCRVKFGQASYVELSGGRMHGGEVCSGGQCIIMPAFSGWKLASHTRF